MQGKGIIRAVAFALVTLPLAGAAAPLRLVFENGWTVPLSGDGSQIAGEAVKLDLPAQARGVYSVTVDHAQQKAYVVIDAPYNHRGTAVFALGNLQRIGFLPGVTEVEIPADPRADVILTSTHVVSGPDAPRKDSIDYLMFDASDRVHGEVRRRSEPSTVIGRGVENSGEMVGACHVAGSQAFLGNAWFRRFDYTLSLLPAPPPLDTPAARAKELRSGWVQDCWPNGDILLARFNNESGTENGLDPTGELTRIAANGERHTFTVPARYWGRYGSYRALALGSDGRYALLASGLESVIYDFQSRKDYPVRLHGNRLLAQLSADRKTVYSFDLHWTLRGATDLRYIEGGSSRVGSTFLAMLTLADVPVSAPVRLPEELVAIRTRRERIAHIQSSEGATEEDKQRQLAQVPPLSAVAEKLGDGVVVGVLPMGGDSSR
ncbi:hypothetical protein [Tahibacter amnicola]|uniref:Uncharacterized protein n=1 Tax=Tahibacter amnicola TaxID=2976241 RepID=A0ABY6BAG3_9GAMM|nr:hypothetical protein [Tahibacter amnicola]UXI66511.1 hypothetical protein N4264_17375 [Tahibacter amnicola]